ncbi:MAG TPA: cupin domain-containing protein [Mariprofundaceae bacterium]|nr:cupin domain-containing protein [Mariprofundaceae bacterium]
MTIRNIFEAIPADLPEELVQILLENRGVRIERIVSRGHASPAGFWYDQPDDEWVLLLTGSAGIQFEGEAVVRELGPGDHLLIPAHRRHRVVWTDADGDTVWLAVFFH